MFEESDVTLADFQILEAPHTDAQSYRGPQFHVNLQCPTCESFKVAFVCPSCVKNDSIFSIKSGKVRFRQNSDRIVTVRRLIDNLNRKIKAHEPALFKLISHTLQTRTEELNAHIASLEHTIKYFSESNMEKRRRVHRIRQSMTRCYTASQQLSKQQASLVRHFVTVAQRKKILVVDLDFINQEIKQIHDKYFTELLGVYFVTELSADGLSPDRFVDSPLHIDKENIFTGPEPTPSSHTALTYCSVAIRVATILLDVWLPLFLRRSLHLVGSFLSALPQRDDMGRVYSAVIHAVHLLCQSRGIDVKCRLEQLGINMVPGRYTYYNPLFGLYCLGNPVSCNNKSTRYFDECYTIKLNGLFGTIPSFNHFNHSIPVRFNSCYFQNSFEKGEEVDEMFGLSSSNESTVLFNEKSDHPPHTLNSTTTPSTSECCCIHSSSMTTTGGGGGGHCEEYKSSVSLECWELVSLTPPPPLESEASDTMGATHPPAPPPPTTTTTMTSAATSDSVTSSFDSLHHSSPLSTVWRLAKVIMRTSEPGSSSESNC